MSPDSALGPQLQSVDSAASGDKHLQRAMGPICLNRLSVEGFRTLRPGLCEGPLVRTAEYCLQDNGLLCGLPGLMTPRLRTSRANLL